MKQSNESNNLATPLKNDILTRLVYSKMSLNLRETLLFTTINYAYLISFVPIALLYYCFKQISGILCIKWERFRRIRFLHDRK